MSYLEVNTYVTPMYINSITINSISYYSLLITVNYYVTSKYNIVTTMYVT
jgi:hypothetical protein